MSKRHQSNRRKTYGRRQHELHERHQRDLEQPDAEPARDEISPGTVIDRFSFLDARPSRLRYALGD